MCLLRGGGASARSPSRSVSTSARSPSRSVSTHTVLLEVCIHVFSYMQLCKHLYMCLHAYVFARITDVYLLRRSASARSPSRSEYTCTCIYAFMFIFVPVYICICICPHHGYVFIERKCISEQYV